MSAEDLFASLNRDFYGQLTPAAQAQISATIELIEHGLYTSGLTSCCTFAVVLYDTIASFLLERKYMWPAKLSLMKVLYFFTRYMYLLEEAYVIALFYGPWTPASCRPVMHLVGLLPIFVVVPTHALLMIRAWAIWERKKWILFTTIPLMVVESGLMAFAAYDTDTMVPFVRKTGSCLISGVAGHGVAFHATISFLDLYLTGLVISKTWHLKRMQRGVAFKSLGNFIFSQSLGYYLVIAGAAVTNLIWMSLRMQYSDFTQLSMIATTTQILLTLRMTLSLKIESATSEHQQASLPLQIRSSLSTSTK